MYRNLDVDHYRNGDSIPEVRDSAQWVNLKTGAWCYYNNDSALGTIYGKLYNLLAVNDSLGLAPEGWHIANYFEWEELNRFLGGQYDVGGKLKETGTNHWLSPNKGASNESGFSALPGGYRGIFSEFGNIGYRGHWWTSAEYSSFIAWIRILSFNNVSFDYGDGNGVAGFSVRCIKDK
jgi:uncharacterized protein (TIGR02145 family)